MQTGVEFLARDLASVLPTDAKGAFEGASTRKADLQWLAQLSLRLGALLHVDWLRTQSDLSTLQCHVAVAIHDSVGGWRADADELLANGAAGTSRDSSST